MDLTQGTPKEKNDRSKKMMLWFGIVSLLMAFAGWTSAYIVSSKREDWLSDIVLPSSFYISTAIIILSSITYFLAKKAIQKDAKKVCTSWLLITLGLGVIFIGLQFNGFSQLVSQGYYFTGPTSSIKMSYIFLIAAVHIVHVVAGIISLLVVLFNQIKGKYNAGEYLGLSLGATFWHFLDLLWVYLILFMVLVG
ncbi:heme-copper oxidase subunit III [Maribacter sp. HTCC2170]|uniref:cytochrome c oxidase subunit 3 n=1 Tax=Maribacter sp. (strain HTCC2170 / KCCM 42371) TaxID=313603 RepID=UPI00006BD3CE|nr:cytochrome c oxidase subunit 3 [Maribacter sp. HTCC2170]EAR02215.1 Cytochrome o ubiquinol oxidase subunit III [Maribacter sp. HTCC2170]